jgi:hypothetical protein
VDGKTSPPMLAGANAELSRKRWPGTRPQFRYPVLSTSTVMEAPVEFRAAEPSPPILGKPRPGLRRRFSTQAVSGIVVA